MRVFVVKLFVLLRSYFVFLSNLRIGVVSSDGL
jgi:hypothetical protein